MMIVNSLVMLVRYAKAQKSELDQAYIRCSVNTSNIMPTLPSVIETTCQAIDSRKKREGNKNNA